MKHLFTIAISIISGFLMAQPLSGTYTIGGSNPDYPKMSDAVDALDSLGINGPVTFNIRNGTYIDYMVIGNINGTSDTSWVTFQSESGDSSAVIIEGFTGPSPDRILAFGHATNIRIKDLTFLEPDASQQAITAHRGHSLEFLNCVFRSSLNTVHQQYLLNMGMDSNLVINNCLFTGATKDLVVGNIGRRYNISIKNCEFNGGLFGLWFTDLQSVEISNCNFYGTYDGVGIRRMILLDDIGELTMVNNFIDGSQTFAQGYALEIRATTGIDTSYIMNNIILSAANSAVGNAGILFGNVSGGLGNVVFAHNTIRFQSNSSNHSVFRSGSCFLPGVRMYNNIIVNESGGYLFDDCAYPTDYNLLYTTGAISPIDSSFAQLQQSGRDTHSVFAPPQFDTLLPGLSHAPEIDSAGFPFNKFPTDYVGNYRDPQYPDIGPYEFINPPLVRFPQDTVACSDVLLDAGNPGATYLWSTGDTTRSITIDSTASYWVTATNSKGSDTDTIQVNINSLVLPAYQLQASSDSLCPGGCISLSTTLDSNRFQLVWSDTASGVIGTGSGVLDCPLYLPKTYYLQIEDSLACPEFDSITVYPKTTSTRVSATMDTAICHGDSLLLSVSSTDSIASAIWTTAGQSVGNGPAVWVKPDSLSLYEVYVTHANGCVDSAFTQVNIDSLVLPAYQLQASSDSLCPGGCVSLHTTLDSSRFQLVWSDTSSGVIGTGSGVLDCPLYLPKTYYLKIEDSLACQELDSITVYPRNTPPPVSATVDTTICHGDSLLLSVSSSDSIASATWTTSGQSVGNGLAVWVKPDSLSFYEVYVNLANGCVDSASTEVAVHYVTSPVISLNFDTLSVSDGWTSYHWQGDGNPVPAATDSFLVALQNGNYTVMVTDSMGCSATSSAFTFGSFDMAQLPSPLLKLYPNPAEQRLTIEVGLLITDPDFRVYNSVGQGLDVEVSAEGGQVYQLNVESLRPGVYFLQLASEGRMMVREFVKQ